MNVTVEPGSTSDGEAPSRSLVDRLLHLLLPAPCLGCAAPLPARPSPLGLCVPCRRKLPTIDPEAPACAQCGAPLAAGERALPADRRGGRRCERCRRHPPAFDRLLAVWHYRPPVQNVLLGLKLRRLEYLGRHLGPYLEERLRASTARDPVLARALDGDAAVVPVPLHWRRRLRRGYNQAEEIARPLARGLGLPLRRCLRRRRATRRQTSLPRELRQQGPVGAFVCRRPCPRTVVLVDDVVTTGSTLAAAAASLQRAGAERVIALVAARTPKKSTDLACVSGMRQPIEEPPGRLPVDEVTR